MGREERHEEIKVGGVGMFALERQRRIPSLLRKYGKGR